MRCLLVGDGDLSFSLALARKWENEVANGDREPWSIVATCFDDADELLTKYRHAAEIIQQLESLSRRAAEDSCRLEVLAAVDATRLSETLKASRYHSNDVLVAPPERFDQDRCNVGGRECEPSSQSDYDDKGECQMLFDRITFQFPHRGGKNFMGKNRELLASFLRSASALLERHDRPGEIMVTLLAGQGGTDYETLHLKADRLPNSRRLAKRVHGDHWQLTEMAAMSGLIVTPSTCFFDPSSYPEYRPRGYRNTLDNASRGFTLDYSVSHVLTRSYCEQVSLSAELRGLEEISEDRLDTSWRAACDTLCERLVTLVRSVGMANDVVKAAPGRPCQSVNSLRIPFAIPAGHAMICGVDTRLHSSEVVVALGSDAASSVNSLLESLCAWMRGLCVGAEITVVESVERSMDCGEARCSAHGLNRHVTSDDCVTDSTITRSETLLDKQYDRKILRRGTSHVIVMNKSTDYLFESNSFVRAPVAHVDRYRCADNDTVTVLHISVVLEAILMVGMGIPTLQHLWSRDPNITQQFTRALDSMSNSEPVDAVFHPRSVLQHTFERQVCFWLPPDHREISSQWSVERFLCILVEHFEGSVVRVSLKSDYQRSDKERSHNYRIVFWSAHGALADSTVTNRTNELYEILPRLLGVQMR